LIEEVDIGLLPSNWQEPSAYPELQKIGEEWHRLKRSPILKVPSAIVPVEYNYMLNPEHPQLDFLASLPIEFKFDRRMWKQVTP
jgi:RES domain-containing protein